MPEIMAQKTAVDGRFDFDFLFGRWSIVNRRLSHPLAGSHDWYQFKATSSEEPILGGLGNIERYDAPDAPKPIHAVAVRLYNTNNGDWSIYWSPAGSGGFSIPTTGKFEEGIGSFYDREEFNGRPIVVRYRWTHEGSAKCRWVQAFSPDGGKTWEDNWIMDFTRLGK